MFIYFENPFIDENQYLIIYSNHSIRRARIQSLNRITNNVFDLFETIITVEREVQDFDFDINRNLFIWLQKQDLANSLILMTQFGNNFHIHKKQLNTSELVNVKSLSYDWIHQLLYITFKDSIQILDINNPSKLYPIIVNKRVDQIIVNPIDSFILFIDMSFGATINITIIKANADGSEEIVLDKYKNRHNLSMGRKTLTIDYKMKRLLLIIDDDLISMDYFGRYKAIYKLFYHRINWMNPFNGDIYYLIEYAPKSIFRTHLDKTLITSEDIYSNDIEILGLKIFHSSRQPNGPNKCLNNKCQTLCVPRNTTYYSCICQRNDTNEKTYDECEYSVSISFYSIEIK